MNFTRALFIKLGEGGAWEEDCIASDILRLGWDDANFDDCSKGKWDQIEKFYLEKGKSQIATTGYLTQIKYFFEEDENTVWITFFNNKLWWTRAENKVILDPIKGKIRRCVGRWSDKTLAGDFLYTDRISGNLLKTQGFRGAICTVKAEQYLFRKIMGFESQEIAKVKASYKELQTNVKEVIKDLTWQDFELFVDLIFSKAGWQRLSAVGKTTKTLDLDLLAPVTGEKCLVQIKSQSNQKELNFYVNTFLKMNQYDKFYYVCHSFENFMPQNSFWPNNIKVLLIDELSGLAIESGLVKWLCSKVS